MQHQIYYGTNKFEFCNVKRETQDKFMAIQGGKLPQNLFCLDDYFIFFLKIFFSFKIIMYLCTRRTKSNTT
jgi:hypothetical protein